MKNIKNNKCKKSSVAIELSFSNFIICLCRERPLLSFNIWLICPDKIPKMSYITSGNAIKLKSINLKQYKLRLDKFPAQKLKSHLIMQ